MSTWILTATLLRAAAPATEATPLDVNISYDTSEVGTFAEFLDPRLDNVIAASLERTNMRNDGASRRAVKISIVREKGKPAFSYEVTATFGGEPVEGGVTRDRCDRCVPEDVVRRIIPVLDLQLALLKASTKAAEPHPAVTDRPPDGGRGPSATTGFDPPPQNGDGEHKKVGGLGWAGIGVGIGGVAIAGTGIGLIVRPARIRRDADAPERSTETSSRTPGIALAVVGGSLAVAGIVMIAVDHGRLKRKRKNLAWAPSWSPGFAGFEMKGRF